MASAKEWQRKCDRCGRVWFVTKEDRKLKKPNRFQTVGLKMNAAGNRGKLIGGKKKALIAEQRLARLAGQGDRWERVNRCSECGSGQFTETAS